jgi:glycerol-3-phosphate dehydrogenase (NAD(P)+)
MAADTDMSFLRDCDAVLAVVPAQHLDAALSQLAGAIASTTPVALCAKGLVQDGLRWPTDVLAARMPDAPPAVLSGPSFAIDVARGLPTAVTLAAPDSANGETWARSIGRSHFRIYLSDDMIGAEVGGAVKNVLAIACGIIAGRRFGSNAQAALITRGFAELSRFGIAMGARPETLAGLSGLGDLILTCSSQQSRNMSLGLALGEGKSLAEILGSRKSVSEGTHSAAAVVELASKKGVEMPVCEAVRAVLSGETDVDGAITALLSRPFRAEADRDRLPPAKPDRRRRSSR